MIKELVSVGTKTAVSGKGYFQGEFISLEATIKSKADFPNQPGNWAYFSFSDKGHKTLKEQAQAFPASSCHQKAATDDIILTQHYPVLSFAKGKGQSASGGFDRQLNNRYIAPE